MLNRESEITYHIDRRECNQIDPAIVVCVAQAVNADRRVRGTESNCRFANFKAWERML